MTSLSGLKMHLSVGLAYKLVLAPAILSLLYLGLLGLHGPTTQVTLFEAAMAPMITAGIVAIDHDLDPPLVTMLLGIGIPLSFVTLAGWAMVLKGF
jgi:malate permease and related proteins